MKTYLVTGPMPFMGYKPGIEFQADLTQGQEDRRVASGHIGIVTDAPPNLVAESEAEGVEVPDLNADKNSSPQSTTSDNAQKVGKK